MNSPFFDKRMIDDPARFFGRKQEKRSIFNELAAERPQCVAIIGDRRIGRSSLLKNVEQTYPQHLRNPERYHFAYVNAQSDTCLTPNNFYAEVAQAFFGIRAKELDPHDFSDLLHDKNLTGATKFILLLDEFNTLQRRKDVFNDDFYDGLRARTDSGMITYVLASHIELKEVAIQHEFGSTFFGIFTHVTLGEFSNDEARASVLRPVTPQLTGQDFGRIARLQKEHYYPMASQTYHPLKLNIGANLVWQDRAEGKKPNFTKITKKYDEQVSRTFGTAITQRRKQIAIRSNLVSAAHRIKSTIEWFFPSNRHLLPLFLFICLLVYLGYLSWDQLLDWANLSPSTPAPSTPTP